ncbi:Pentatricopeptide repeat-containing protein, mitochondrial [Rhodotorula toruloides]|nr:Pentatricopeptide repeat-containing protein, mitochondrial [Rhodotorula toruloides]
MVHLPLFAACVAAVFYQATTCAALPLVIRPSATAIVPVTYAFNPQRPFARLAPSPRLHVVDDSSDSEDATLAPSWIAPEPFAAQASLAAAVNDDSLFSDALYPYAATASPTGIEASIAAVLASRQLQGVEKWQPDAGPKEKLHRRSAVFERNRRSKPCPSLGSPRQRLAYLNDDLLAYTSIRPLSTPRNSPNGTSASFRLPPLDSPSFTAITTASLLRLLSHNGYQHTRQDLQRLAHFILWLEQRSPSSTLPLPPAGLARLPLILLRTFLAVVLATLPFVPAMPSPRLVSSSRALLSTAAAQQGLLDVFAPAAFASLSLHPRSYSQAPSRPPPRSSAPPSNNPSRSQDRPAQRRDSSPSRRDGPRAPQGRSRQLAPKKKEQSLTERLRMARQDTSTTPSPSTSNAPNPADLLSEIRATAHSRPYASVSHDDDLSTLSPVQVQNQAVLNLVNAVSTRLRNYDLMFVKGWKPLREAGQIGRMKESDVAEILWAALAKIRETGAAGEGTHWHWKEIRELALWVAGGSERTIVTEWAWQNVYLGYEGCERVIDLWEAICRGEAAALRRAPNGPNHAFKPAMQALREDGAPEQIRLPVGLFNLSCVAHALLRARLDPSERPPFASMIPKVVSPHLRGLKAITPEFGMVQRLGILRTCAVYKVDRSNAVVPSGIVAPSVVDTAVIPFLRQVGLARDWYFKNEPPGARVVKDIQALLRAGSQKQAWKLWNLLQEALASPDLAWLGTDEWLESSRAKILVADEDGNLINASQPNQGELPPDKLDPKETSAEAESEENAVDEDAALAVETVSLAVPIEPAQLHQRHIGGILIGFVKAKLMDHANTIWGWLAERGLSPGVACWTGLLNGYVASGALASVEAVFRDMQRTPGLEPDYYSWMARSRAHFAAKDPEAAMRCAREMMRDKHVLDDLQRSGLKTFPVVTWDSLIDGLLSCGRRQEADALFTEMQKSGLEPSMRTFNTFLAYCTRGKKPDLATMIRLLQQIAERGLEPDVYTFTMVLHALLAVGQKDATNRTIEMMQAAGINPTRATYGAVIHSLASSGEPEKLSAALQLLDEMESKKMETNEIIYTSLIQNFLRAIGTSGSGHTTSEGRHPYADAAMMLKKRMETRGKHLNRIGYNALIAAGFSLQSEWGTDLAMRMFAELKRRPNTLHSPFTSSQRKESGNTDRMLVNGTYYVMLDGLVRNGDYSAARNILHEMERSGFEVRSKPLQRLSPRWRSPRG